MKQLTQLIAITALCMAALPALADKMRLPATPNAAWQEECTSCHIGYPPSLLSAANWRQMMGSLDRHFGANAELDAKTRDEIRAFLEQNAATKESRQAPSLRISETPWFVRKHDEVPTRAWSDPSVKSAANCSACHRDAGKGNYNEHQVVLPVAARR